MIKEFEINDILDAVKTISNIKEKNVKINEKKISDIKNEVPTPNNQVKSGKREILVLEEMIE